MQPPNLTDAVSTEPTPERGMTALEAALKRWTNRTPEQKLADREMMKKSTRKGRPLPEGKTLDDVLRGQWLGDESDEVIFEYLKRLS